MLLALKELDIYDEYSVFFDSNCQLIDEMKIERLRRMTARIQNMSTTMYEKFSAARTMSFCSKNGKK